MNSNTLLGIFVGITVLSLLVLASAQSAYAQESGEALSDLQALLTSITAIITAIGGIAGSVIASYARMSQKLGTATDAEIKKMLLIANELQDSDNWSKQLEKDLLALAQVVEALPGGQKILEEKRVDIKQWKEAAAKLDTEIADIYKKMMPLLLLKK